MKQLIDAIREVPHDDSIKPLENAFSDYEKLSTYDIENYEGSFNQHILLQAFLTLRKEGYYYASIKDIEEFRTLITAVKSCQEVKNEDIQAKTTNPGRRKLRIHHRKRRT